MHTSRFNSDCWKHDTGVFLSCALCQCSTILPHGGVSTENEMNSDPPMLQCQPPCYTKHCGIDVPWGVHHNNCLVVWCRHTTYINHQGVWCTIVRYTPYWTQKMNLHVQRKLHRMLHITAEQISTHCTGLKKVR